MYQKARDYYDILIRRYEKEPLWKNIGVTYFQTDQHGLRYMNADLKIKI